MRLEIRMPRKSEFSDDGKIAKWLVSVGDVIAKGDPIADIEVDMTTAELFAEADGKIVEIWVHAGQSVPVETVIAMQSADDDAIADEGDEAADTDEGDDTEEAVSDAGGSEQSPEKEEEFPEMSEEILSKVPVSAEGAGSDDAVVQHGHVLASPSAVQLAEQYNVNLETLTGTGSCGRIEREDVEAAMQTTSQFITPEDVDDLMNFDGDFTSEFSNKEPTAEETPALAEDAAAEADQGQVTEEPEVDQAEEETLEDESGAVYQDQAEEAATDQPEGTEEDTSDEESEPTFEEPGVDQPEEAAESSEQDEQEDVSEETVPAEEEEQDQDSESYAAATGDEMAEESVEAEDAATDQNVIYMGAGPESTVETPADDDEQPEPVLDETVISEEPAVEESQEMEISVEVQPDEEDSVAEEQEEDAAPAETEPEESPAEDFQEPTAVEEAMEEPSVSAYEPSAEERAAVSGFAAMADSESEPEALAVDESDTIDSEEVDDLEAAVDEELAAEPEPVQLDTATVDTAIEQATAEESRKSVKVRRLVARKMEQSWQHAPHFFVTVAVDMTDVIRFRSDLGVTINDFILAATTRALQEHPWVNSHFIDDEAVEQPEVNISLAVETEQGLYYPVIRDCGGKSVKDLGISAAELVVKTHSGKLTDEEMENGSFTISNMGMLGVESFSAIITPPQVAVLAVGTVRGEVVIDEHEEMTMAPMVRLTLSADHRALDGADAADFLGTMKSYLEAPITLVASQDE